MEARSGSRARRVRRDVEDFVRSYSAGVKSEDLRRLFERDASRAYGVLTRDQPRPEAEQKGLRGGFHRARLLFLGLSYKLTPARRVVFAASLFCALLGMADVEFRVVAGSTRVVMDASPVFFLAAIAGLLYLLAVELVDRVLVRDELQVARQLQSDLLPRAAPPLPGWSIAHSYRTANEVGGDYHCFFPLPDGRLALAIGDASGHGMAAGLLMAIANATLQTAVDIDPAPARAAALLNRVLCRTGDRRAFMTLFYAVLDPATGRLDYVCAGHPFPLLRRADGAVEELGRGSLPLGMRDPAPLPIESAALAPGDHLLLYTDGLPEAVGAGGAAFGFDRLASLLAAGGAPQAILDRTLEEFTRHLGNEALADDLTVVVLGREPRPT
jgi:hypothetical protein